MESDFTPEAALQEIDRAAVAPWIDYPPTPWWYYPVIGAWTAALTLAVGLDGLWAIPAVVGLVVLELWFVSWMKRQRGTWPRVTKPPAEFKPAIRGFIVGTAVLVLVWAALMATVGPVAAAPVAFVGVTVGLYVYEKAYERAVERTRQRLEQQ